MTAPRRQWALGLSLIGGAVIFGAGVLAAEPNAFVIHTARMEGAAVNVRESADAVEHTAHNIATASRIQDMALLMSQMTDLNRRVISARLAAEVMTDE